MIPLVGNIFWKAGTGSARERCYISIISFSFSWHFVSALAT